MADVEAELLEKASEEVSGADIDTAGEAPHDDPKAPAVIPENSENNINEPGPDLPLPETSSDTPVEPDTSDTLSSGSKKPALPKKITLPEKPNFDFKAAFNRCAASFKHYFKIISAAVIAFLSYVGSECASIIKKCGIATGKFIKSASVNTVRVLKTDGVRVTGSAFGALRFAGKSAWDVFSYVFRTVFGVIKSFLGSIFGAVFGWISKKFRQPLLEIWCFIATPFAHAWGGVAGACIRFKNACKRGFLPAVGVIFNSIWRFLGSLVRLFRFAFNYIAPAVCVVFLIGLIRYASTLQYAISVTYNGSDIGTIENEATYNEAQTLIQDKVTFTSDEQPLLVTPKFSVTVINLDESEKQPTADIDALSETMIEQGDVQIVYAYGLSINGELFGVYSEEDMQKIRNALETKLNSYSTVNAVNVSFEDDIVIEEGRYVQDILTDPADALELINGGTDVEAYYVVERGDTISGICEKLGITREDFDKYNPGVEKVHHDDIITYHYTEPHLNVLTTYYEAYEQVIERTTEYVETSRREQYCEILLQHGSDGLENVTALVTLKNGVESDRTIVSRTVLEEMVPRKFRVGTKPNTYLKNTDIIDKLGTFCWPLGDEDCYISTMPGWRSWDSSNHMALDIAGIPRGTDIYAACDGKVTYSGWYAAYGELVIVDCGSGYECYYAHCSKRLVEEGDRVEKGDTIAEVGMTGSASGNHLHFEMRHYGDRINPLDALGGTGGHEIRE